MTESWARSQERKREIASIAICGSAYALGLLVLWFLGAFNIKDLSDYSGPIQVKLGSPEGVAESAFLSGQTEEQAPPEELPEDEIPEPPPPDTEDDDAVSDNTIADKATPSPSTPKPTPSRKPSPSAKPSLKPSPKPSSTPKPLESPKPTPSPRASVLVAKVSLKPEVVPASSPGSGSGSSANAKPAAAVIRGSEQGNSYETNFDEGASVVGRGLYVPIYLYLPLPYYVDTAYYEAIKASADGFTSAENRRAEFKKHYRVGEGGWVLRNPVPYDDRPRLWILLGESGYDISKSDYKAKALRSVVLQFQVGAQKGNAIPSLESVKLLSSSGYSDIDDSVMYGFKKAAFYNNSPKSVTGRFTYSFD